MILKAFGNRSSLSVADLRSELLDLFGREAENMDDDQPKPDPYKQAIGSIGGASRHHTISIANGTVTLLV